VLLAWRRRLDVLNNDAEGCTVLKLGFPNFGLEPFIHDLSIV